MTKERLMSLLLMEETEDIEYPWRCLPKINHALAEIKAERIMSELVIEKEKEIDK